MEKTFSPNKTKHLYEKVEELILQFIFEGKLQSGDRLPAERSLAETFRVSRNSVREAIRALTEKKVLESRRGDGTYIRDPDDSALVTTLAQTIRIQQNRLNDIFEFREMIEPQTAALAARYITQDEVAALKILVFEQERKIIAGEDIADLDMQFHLRLAEASRNLVLLEVVKLLNGILLESRSEFLQTEARRFISVKSHIEIIDALEKHDEKAACKNMLNHLQQVRKTIHQSN